MQVASVTARTVAATRRFGESSAVKEGETSTFVLLEVEAEDGTVGVGEISDVEDPDAMPDEAAIEAELESFLVGRDPRRINHLTGAMADAIDFGPLEFHSFQQLALAAVDHALHDLAGRSYGVPVYGLLGGRTGDVPICWVVYTRQSGDEIDALREEVRTKVEQGFEAFKLKAGEVDPAVDEERIRTVREVAGEDAGVFLDAQGVWELEEAIETIRRFESLGIDGVETPVGHPDESVDAPGYYYDVPLLPGELATVREETDTPVLEHVHDPAFGLELVAADAVDVFTVEACAGGLRRAERILDIAAGAGIDARLGGTAELGPGTVAAASLAASSTAITYPCDLIGPGMYEDSVLAEAVTYYDGHLRPAEAPGFGFTLDP